MRKKFRNTICLFLVLVFSLGYFSSAIADTTPEITDEMLIDAASDILDEYSELYDIYSTFVESPIIYETEDGYDVEYFLGFSASLKASTATDLPHIQGMAKALGINASDIDTEVLIAQLESSVAANTAMVNTADMEKTAQFSSKGDYAIALSNRVANQVISFLENFEEEYIGTVSDYNFGLKASFDSECNFIDIKSEVFDRYDDIVNVMPESEEQMYENGIDQVAYEMKLAQNELQKAADFPISPAVNPWIYMRIDARDYANTYTSNATAWCPHGSAQQNTAYYRSNYTWYCHNDCANYVSQAMSYGYTPVSSTWAPGTYAWINCVGMRNYFYYNNNYWTTMTYANCAAGGIMLMLNSSGTPSHVNMIVHNDTVTRKLSAHTTDRKEFVYTASWTLSGGYNEYYWFSNCAQ